MQCVQLRITICMVHDKVRRIKLAIFNVDFRRVVRLIAARLVVKVC